MCRNVSAVLQHPLERKPLLRAVDGPEALHCSVVTFRARGRRHNIFIATAANMISTSQQPGKQTKIKKRKERKFQGRFWDEHTRGHRSQRTEPTFTADHDFAVRKRFFLKWQTTVGTHWLTWMYFLCVSSLRTWATCLEKIFSRPVRAWMPTMVTPMGQGALPMAICR